MPVIKQRIPWTRQPQVQASHGMGKDVFVIDGRSGLMLPARRPSSSNLTVSPGADGIARKGSADTHFAAYAVPSFTIGTRDFTLAMDFQYLSAETASYSYIFGSNTIYFAFALRHANASNNAFFYCGATQISTGISASAAGVYRCVLRRRSGVVHVSINDKKYSVANTDSIGAITAISSGSFNAAGSFGPSVGSHYYLTVLDPTRGWTDSEAEAFIGNPWQIFTP
jgi:hypothetical protein